MKHSPARVLKQWFDDNGYTTDWLTSATGEPNSPDNCITVYNTAGVPQGRLQVSGRQVVKYGLQVRVRSGTNAVGWQKAHELKVALDEALKLDTVTVDDSTYLLWSADTDPVLDLNKNAPASKRSLFTINLRLAVNEE